MEPAPVEPEAERAVNRVVPWVVSAGLHAGMIALGLLVTGTIVSLRDRRDPVLVTAEFDALRYDPLVPLEAVSEQAPAETLPARLKPDPLEARLAQQLADLDIPPVFLEAAPAAIAGPVEPSGNVASSATFVGLTSTNARNIVYVIDASGSMIQALPVVIAELAESLADLAPPQRFAVIFFQHGEALVVPPPGRLQDAAPEARARALEWIDGHVAPAGGSNPLAAIERAMSLEPDVIFLLSENITGSGRFEIDQADLLGLLETLNPLDDATGLRPTRINCVQFLDPDPLDTLKEIAERHGGGQGYRFLGRPELGLEAP